MLRVLVCAAALALAAAPSMALGGEPDADLSAARAHADAAYDLYAQGDYRGALGRFQRAEKLHHAPPHLLYMARCLTKLGRLLEARKVYLELAGEVQPADAPEPFFEAQRDAKKELSAVEGRIARLTIVVRGAPSEIVKVTIDGRAVAPAALSGAIELDPGEHHVVASAEGYSSRDHSVTLGEAASESVSMSLESRAPAPAPEPDRASEAETPALVGPIVLLAVGGAGLVVGAVAGGLAIAKQGELEDACPQKTSCPPESQQLEKDGRALGNASTVGFVVGGVAAGAGIVWLIVAMTEAPETSDARVLPLAGDGTAGLVVRF